MGERKETNRDNPARGFGPKLQKGSESGASLVRLAQPRPAWGALVLATGELGFYWDKPGDQAKRLTANSSTMKGGRPLAGKLSRRRSRTAKSRRRWVRRGFYVRPPEIKLTSGWRLCPRGSAGHATPVRGVTPASDANARATFIANLGAAAGAGYVTGEPEPGLVRRARGAKTPQRGSGAQVESLDQGQTWA